MIKLLKLYGMSMGLFLAMLLLGGLLFWKTDLPEGLLLPWSIAALSLAGGLFGWGAAHLRGRGGLLTGLLAAAVFTASALLAAAFLLPEKSEIHWLRPCFLVPLLAGAAGGFWGVNGANESA